MTVVKPRSRKHEVRMPHRGCLGYLLSARIMRPICVLFDGLHHFQQLCGANVIVSFQVLETLLGLPNSLEKSQSSSWPVSSRSEQSALTGRLRQDLPW